MPDSKPPSPYDKTLNEIMAGSAQDIRNAMLALSGALMERAPGSTTLKPLVLPSAGYRDVLTVWLP